MKGFLDLTDRAPMTFDVERMKAELRAVESEDVWVDHYDAMLADGWRAVPLVSHRGEINGPESQRWGDVREFRRTALVDKMPYFRSILDAFPCPHGRIRVLRLKPGGTIGVHRDVGNEVASYAHGKVRLHVPIQTNPDVRFLFDGEQIRMAPGRLYYCDFTKRHAVHNGGTEPRIHLVMDLVVNEFLKGVFPELSPMEKAQHWAERRAMPVFWGALEARTSASKAFWRNYNGSAAQKAVKKVRGR